MYPNADPGTADGERISGIPWDSVWKSSLRTHSRLVLKRQARRALQSLLIDTILLFLATGVSLLASVAVSELILGRPFEILGQPGKLNERFVELFVLAALLMAWFAKQGHHSRRLSPWHEAKDTTTGVFLVAVADVAVQYLSKDAFSRLWLVQNWSLAFVFLLVGRYQIRRALIASGGWQLPTLIIGRHKDVPELVDALDSEPALGHRVLGVLDPNGTYRPTEPGHAIEQIAREGTIWSGLPSLCQRHGIEKIVLTYDETDIASMNNLLREFARHGLPHAVMLPIREVAVSELHVQHFTTRDVVLLEPRNNLAGSGNRAAKRAFDILVAAAGLLFLAPLLLLLALMVRADGGPALYAQVRCGMYGRSFRCFKFRSMVQCADLRLKAYLEENPRAAAEFRKDFKLRDDPRITPLGHFLRQSSLDELPQLFNVLIGDMSLVGPRPITDSERSLYGDNLSYYLQVRPGITGLWQVNGRSDVNYQRRVALDSWYVRNWSLWHDLVILCGTLPAVLKRNGAY